MIEEIRSVYREDRVSAVDEEFLRYEEQHASPKDLELILRAAKLSLSLPNPHNSIILFVTGASNEFNAFQGRSDTVGGSPPDIDLDFDSLDIDKAIDYTREKWGPTSVASIMATGTFKPRGLADRWFDITEAPREDKYELVKLIPPPKYGKEPNLDMVKGECTLDQLTKFEDFFNEASVLENLVQRFGIHAAGIVITNDPLSNHVPLYMTKDNPFITQFNKDELEGLGLLKFDYLTIENLSICKEVCRLIELNHQIKVDINTIPDGDETTYQLMEQGLLAGVFQMETSGTAKDLIQEIKPRSIFELSDINAINRPGPLQSNLDKEYLDNKLRGKAPADMPPMLANILKSSWWTMIYQEQVMEMCVKMSGFSELEADNCRRAMGKIKNLT